jgi:hypothetical protein
VGITAVFVIFVLVIAAMAIIRSHEREILACETRVESVRAYTHETREMFYRMAFGFKNALPVPKGEDADRSE